ncbi:hypothetical protein [Kordia sp.]|uniref:hypothetical protein n=1 Tax=Kordia sp. TaxID=1965332 RepID=UPI0025C0385C|nr:hypothetical protein [Kordia sp.]MCH2195240.1 hypothetical protein [Kordia sp.]
MKKQLFKLELKITSVSNLSNIEGGLEIASKEVFCIASFTLVHDICCDQTYPDSELNCLTVVGQGTCALDCEHPKTQIGETC